jgi:hypothetical protein
MAKLMQEKDLKFECIDHHMTFSVAVCAKMRALKVQGGYASSFLA